VGFAHATILIEEVREDRGGRERNAEYIQGVALSTFTPKGLRLASSSTPKGLRDVATGEGGASPPEPVERCAI
jgi:hypothetical protein